MMGKNFGNEEMHDRHRGEMLNKATPVLSSGVTAAAASSKGGVGLPESKTQCVSEQGET